MELFALAAFIILVASCYLAFWIGRCGGEVDYPDKSYLRIYSTNKQVRLQQIKRDLDFVDVLECSGIYSPELREIRKHAEMCREATLKQMSRDSL